MKYLYAITLQKSDQTMIQVNVVSTDLASAVTKALAANAGSSAINAGTLGRIDLE